jgi:hypothetical protein
VRQIEIRTNRLVTDTLAGQYHSVFKGRGMNFDAVREYTPGVDLVANADSPLAEHRGTLGEFLGHCDLAKFAKWQLSVPQMEAMLQSARDFILATGQPVKARRPETRALGSRPAVTQA